MLLGLDSFAFFPHDTAFCFDLLRSVVFKRFLRASRHVAHFNGKVGRSQKTDLEEFYPTADLSNFENLKEELKYWQGAQLPVFRKCVKQYAVSVKPVSFSYLDQFLCMAFAQLIYRESLEISKLACVLIRQKSTILALEAEWPVVH